MFLKPRALIKMLRKIIFSMINLLFDVGFFIWGILGMFSCINWPHLLTPFANLQAASFFFLFGSFAIFSLNWWVGSGRKLDKIFRDYLFERPFLIGDNMPFSEFSSSTIVKLNSVRAFAYYSLVTTGKKKLPFNAWADDFEYKSKLTLFDKILVWIMDISFLIGFILFGISLL